MTSPVIAQKKPYMVEVEAGKTYYWCSCGVKSRPIMPPPFIACNTLQLFRNG